MIESQVCNLCQGTVVWSWLILLAMTTHLNCTFSVLAFLLFSTISLCWPFSPVFPAFLWSIFSPSHSIDLRQHILMNCCYCCRGRGFKYPVIRHHSEPHDAVCLERRPGGQGEVIVPRCNSETFWNEKCLQKSGLNLEDD